MLELGRRVRQHDAAAREVLELGELLERGAQVPRRVGLLQQRSHAAYLLGLPVGDELAHPPDPLEVVLRRETVDQALDPHAAEVTAGGGGFRGSTVTVAAPDRILRPSNAEPPDATMRPPSGV